MVVFVKVLCLTCAFTFVSFFFFFSLFVCYSDSLLETVD